MGNINAIDIHNNCTPVIGAAVVDASIGKFRTIAMESFATLVTIGTGGIKPCTIPFAIDQFDTTSPEGKEWIIVFLAATRIYIYVPAEGNIFSSIAQVYKKHHLQNPVFKQSYSIQDNEIDPQGQVTNSWRLCGIQQVEEVKYLIKMMPISASGILCLIPNVSQATKNGLAPRTPLSNSHCIIPCSVHRHMALMLYERLVQPALAKITKQEEGL
ncbi:hypothetical protein VNO77_39958 [Canavalia gladiata]|uniref:Uncharacterized protein n=1 Tax=Canavalia gladiata TaxID=3824 RepID=A0AAN9PQW4_CANGL